MQRNALIVIAVVVVIIVAVGAYAAVVLTSSQTTSSTLPQTTSSSSQTSKSSQQIQQITVLNSIVVSPTLGEWYYIQNGGYLKQYGLNATVSSVVGTPTAVRAVVSGSVDMAFTSQDGLVAAVSTGVPLTGFFFWGNVQPFIIVTKNSITSYQGLIGQRLSISGIGALLDQLWTGILNQENISRSQVSLVNVGSSGTARLQALIAGSVDAVMVYPENWQAALALNSSLTQNYHVLGSVGSFFPYWGIDAMVARTDYVQAHPQIIQDVTDALLNMTRQVQSNESRFVQLAMQSFTGYTTTELQNTWQNLNAQNFFSVNGGINFGRVSQLINYTYSVGEAFSNNTYIHGPSSVVDTTFLHNALNSMGVVNTSADIPDWYTTSTSTSTSAITALLGFMGVLLVVGLVRSEEVKFTVLRK
ncbi:MAG: ABC transporter substrate-binding protein [Thaumarchaeota archaeon]|nr:ABC transporter substrate-binding protein [Nitrososphaerota archaeon]MDG6904457.1 ABC transporter substrate-binding protein [Nitrososphaerota archaeon]